MQKVLRRTETIHLLVRSKTSRDVSMKVKHQRPPVLIFGLNKYVQKFKKTIEYWKKSTSPPNYGGGLVYPQL
jgi:hypothetical protein